MLLWINRNRREGGANLRSTHWTTSPIPTKHWMMGHHCAAKFSILLATSYWQSRLHRTSRGPVRLVYCVQYFWTREDRGALYSGTIRLARLLFTREKHCIVIKIHIAMHDEGQSGMNPFPRQTSMTHKPARGSHSMSGDTRNSRNPRTVSL